MKRWSVMQRCIRLILSLVISLQFILYIIANIPRSLQRVVVETLPHRMVDASHVHIGRQWSRRVASFQQAATGETLGEQPLARTSH